MSAGVLCVLQGPQTPQQPVAVIFGPSTIGSSCPGVNPAQVFLNAEASHQLTGGRCAGAEGTLQTTLLARAQHGHVCLGIIFCQRLSLDATEIMSAAALSKAC